MHCSPRSLVRCQKRVSSSLLGLQSLPLGPPLSLSLRPSRSEENRDESEEGRALFSLFFPLSAPTLWSSLPLSLSLWLPIMLYHVLYTHTYVYVGKYRQIRDTTRRQRGNRMIGILWAKKGYWDSREIGRNITLRHSHLSLFVFSQ